MRTNKKRRIIKKIEMGNKRLKYIQKRSGDNIIIEKKPIPLEDDIPKSKVKSASEIKIERVRQIQGFNTHKLPPITNRRPKICLLYDSVGWAYYNKSIALKKYLSEYYDVEIIKYTSITNDKQYDVIISYNPHVITSIRNSQKLITGVSSKFNDIKLTYKRGYSFSNDFNMFNKLKSPKTYYLPNGVDTKFFKTNKERVINKDNISIGLVASSSRAKHKGVERIAEICEILKQRGYNVKNRALVTAPRSRILTRQEMIKYYENIDIFIVSSVSENTPNPLLEAMSMGVPCISNNVGMANLLLDNIKTGFLTESYENINFYVEHIETLINDTELYSIVSKESRVKIQEYDWSLMALKYKEMIDEFLGL